MKPKLILCIALVLSGGLFGCSTAYHHETTVEPELKPVPYDLRPMLHAFALTNGYWQDLAVRLQQSKVPTERKAVGLVISSWRNPMDARENFMVTALFRLARNDAELGNANDLIWEVREMFFGQGVEISGLAWVDALTGKVKILYPK